MANNELKPCPFCGCGMQITSNNDWHRLNGEHDDLCPFDTDDDAMCVPADPASHTWMLAAWNRRATPAQGALTDALPELPSHPEKYHVWTEQERKAIEAYGQQCARSGQVSDAADAARYRWLRDSHTWNAELAGDMAEWGVTLISPYGVTEDEDCLDKAIDAEMADRRAANGAGGQNV